MASLLPPGVLLLLVLAAAVCAQHNTSEANINRITDDVLAGIATYAKDKNLTSIDLPDVQQHFSTSWWILSISGMVNLTDGSLTKFEQVRRYDSSQMTMITSNKQGASHELVLNTGIELPHIDATYDFKASAGVVSQHGKLVVTVSGLKATTMLYMNMDTLKPSMVELKIADMGKIKVSIKDGAVGWLATGIAKVVVGIVRDSVRRAVEQQLPSVINEILDKLDIPDMIRPHLPAAL